MIKSILNYIIQNEPKEQSPKKVFHGGCHGCKMQKRVGTLLCSGCQHFDADWNKPNFNGSDRRRKFWKWKIKFLSKFVSDTKKLEPGIFHGGCLGCSSQKIHGVKRCTGCQYFEADWSLPDLKIKS